MTRRHRDPRTPVLYPPGPVKAAPLPYAVPLLAALGLAVLVLSAVPAVSSQQRLQREQARLEREAAEIEVQLDGLRRELRDGHARRYLHIKATRALLHRGASYIQERDLRLDAQARARAAAAEAPPK